MSRRLLILLTSVICLFPFRTALFAAANDCDRACLKTALDQYMTAVTTHKPSAAPLFAGFRQTENAVVIPMGSGVWKSVTALGKVQRHYLDPVSGNAAYYGTVEEGATSAVVTVRVRVEDHKITEAEWYIARENDPGLNGPRQPGQAPPNLFNPDGLAAAPPPDRVLPKASRASREMLIAVTNSYFDGITSHDSAVVMADPRCDRMENGTSMGSRGGGGGARGTAAPQAGRGAQNTPAPAPQAQPARGQTGVSSCAAGFATINVQLVAARRYPVVDEEAGVVLALAIFIRRPGSTTARNVFSEWFVIDDNKIRNIYTAMFYPPPDQPVPNWPPYEGNWPLPAGVIPAPAAAKD
jgi:hypothetical protein